MEKRMKGNRVEEMRRVVTLLSLPFCSDFHNHVSHIQINKYTYIKLTNQDGMGVTTQKGIQTTSNELNYTIIE